MRRDQPKIPRNVLLIALVALASGFGQDLITPILPGFLVALGVSRAGIGLIDGVLQGTTSLFRFVSGILSDRLKNRKGLVFLGYAFSSAARPLLAFTASFPVLVFLRGLDGVGKGMKDAPRDALVADSTGLSVRGRAFGFHRFVDTAGSVLGPLLAGMILLSLTPSLQSYRLIFLLSAIPGAIALLLIAFGVSEPRKASSPLQNFTTPFVSLPAAFWIFTLGSCVAMLTRINDTLFLVRAGDSGVSPSWIPFLFAGFTLLYAFAAYPIGIWSDRIGRLPLIVAGWTVLGLAELLFSLFPFPFMIIPVFCLFGLFYALTEGSVRAIIADLVVSESRGTAYAIFHSATGVCLIAGGYGLGRVWDVVSPATAFQLAAAGSLFGAFIISASHLKRFMLPSSK